MAEFNVVTALADALREGVADSHSDPVRVIAQRWDLARSLNSDGSSLPDRLFADAPTPHHVRWNGREGWTHCILDALMLPFFNGEPAEVETVTPVRGTRIELRVSDEAVESSHPGARVAVSAAPTRGDDVRRACCPFVLAFADRYEYELWHRQHGDVVSVALTLEEAWRLARLLVRGDAAMEEGCQDDEGGGPPVIGGCC